MKRLLLIIGLAVMMAGCGMMVPRPQKGGSASVGPDPTTKTTESASVGSLVPSAMPNATITQPENPQNSSGQNVSYESEDEVTLPYDVVKTTTTQYPDGRKVIIQEPMPAGTKVAKHIKQNVVQNLGGSWKDTARDMAAALGSFAIVQYVGIAIFLLGVYSFFNVALLKIAGGKDGAAAIAGAGLVMMFGPYLFVAYAKWFFLAIVLAGVYWLLARFKYQHGQLDAIKSGQVIPPTPPPATQ